MHFTSIACVTIDSVMRIDKKKASAGLFRGMQMQKIKETQMSTFINAALKSDSQSESEAELETELKSDAKLMAKLKSDSDSE